MPATTSTSRRLALLALASACLPCTAVADTDYPARMPVKLLVPAAPGGTTDISARLLADSLAGVLGQTIVVDNRAGGSGSIAAQAVARSPADGYTLLFQYSAFHVITPQITPNVNWDPLKDFAPVAHVMLAPQVLVVRSDLPVRTLDELVAFDRKEPGKLNYASSGIGSMQHVGGEMLNQMAGTRFAHIPYKGTGPALTDLMGGAVDFTITTPPPLLSYIQQGRLRALAVTSDRRLPSLPDVPTVAEAGYPALKASSWLAVYAPVGTPKAVVQRLAGDIRKVVGTDEFRKKSEALGAEAVYMSPEELGRYTAEEYQRWGSIVKTASIRAE